jgi:excisionase family DNA binding protein
MTKIDTSQYLTIDEAAEAVGCNRRALYRAMHRAGIDTVTTLLFGKRLVPRDKLDAIKANYFPYYSETHQAMVKTWGAAGGSAKAANRKKAEKN